MSTGTIVVIVVVVVVVAALIAVALLGARRRRLQQQFGPEYDRAVEDSDSKLKAESVLAERAKRVKDLDIRPLDAAARDSYARQWTSIQEQFVDSPTNAVTGAQSLITSVMSDRGYPTDDTDQIMADLSVEHASTLDQYRTAQELSNRAAGGTASTEDLRQAMVHYRTLFRELVGDPAAPADAAPADAALGDAAPGDAAPGDAVPGNAAPADAVPADAALSDATPSSSPPADSPPAGPVSAEGPASTENPEAGQADTTRPAAAGRLPRRR